MRISIGGIIGVFGALLPIVYIGYMLRHFIGVGGGSAEGIVGIGLGPTVLGLAIIGLLFALPLIIKLIRNASGVNRVQSAGLDIGDEMPTEGFDADAALARYMSKRAEAPALADDLSTDPGTPRPPFGRKAV